jgi:predicted TIM-barrel fold metal-dependent hydrolase
VRILAGQILTRRRAIELMSGSTAALLSGCCELRGFPKPSTLLPMPTAPGTPLKPKIVKSANAPSRCIDVHSHFFNASDVPVKGFVEGPVARAKGGAIGALIAALAPLADELGAIAPTAASEYTELLGMASRADLRAMADPAPALQSLVDAYHVTVSSHFYELAKGSAFEKQYNLLQGQRAQQIPLLERGGVNLSPLNGSSMAIALQAGGRPKAANLTESLAHRAQPYPDGVIAFIGYMLSYRWMNLFDYSRAYSSAPGAFGIDQTLGALVDFDRWYECALRSAHEDQIKVFQLMSVLSGGYMKPLAAYNPWNDLKDPGRYLNTVIDAVTNRGFVGIKIYPPTGFRPYDNTTHYIPTPGGPTGPDLDRVLSHFWGVCEDLSIPVMAHTGESWGSTAAADDAANPSGWTALLDKQSKGHNAPIINLGHLGGDETTNQWTGGFAELMQNSHGSKIYGDLAYWDKLSCTNANDPVCGRLRDALSRGAFAKRVMYGSDWLMLAQEVDWWRYPFVIGSVATALEMNANDLFANNAISCFGTRLNTV